MQRGMIDEEKRFPHSGVVVFVQRALVLDEDMGKTVGVDSLPDGVHRDVVLRIHADAEFYLIFVAADKAA